MAQMNVFRCSNCGHEEWSPDNETGKCPECGGEMVKDESVCVMVD